MQISHVHTFEVPPYRPSVSKQFSRWVAESDAPMFLFPVYVAFMKSKLTISHDGADMQHAARNRAHVHFWCRWIISFYSAFITGHILDENHMSILIRELLGIPQCCIINVLENTSRSSWTYRCWRVGQLGINRIKSLFLAAVQMCGILIQHGEFYGFVTDAEEINMYWEMAVERWRIAVLLYVPYLASLIFPFWLSLFRLTWWEK